MIGIHYDNLPNEKDTFYLTPQHVFFTWGKAQYELLQKKGNTCEYILPCGIWIGEAHSTNSLLKKLSKSVKFIISVFDSDSAYNTHQTPETFFQFYTTVIEF